MLERSQLAADTDSPQAHWCWAAGGDITGCEAHGHGAGVQSARPRPSLGWASSVESSSCIHREELSPGGTPPAEPRVRVGAGLGLPPGGHALGGGRAQIQDGDTAHLRGPGP